MESRKETDHPRRPRQSRFGIRYSQTLRSNPPKHATPNFLWCSQVNSIETQPAPKSARRARLNVPHKFWFRPPTVNFVTGAPGMQPKYSNQQLVRVSLGTHAKSYGGKGGYSRPKICLRCEPTAKSEISERATEDHFRVLIRE